MGLFNKLFCNKKVDAQVKKALNTLSEEQLQKISDFNSLLDELKKIV